jgi:hypothetical protein
VSRLHLSAMASSIPAIPGGSRRAPPYQRQWRSRAPGSPPNQSAWYRTLGPGREFSDSKTPPCRTALSLRRLPSTGFVEIVQNNTELTYLTLPKYYPGYVLNSGLKIFLDHPASPQSKTTAPETRSCSRRSAGRGGSRLTVSPGHSRACCTAWRSR